VRLVSKAVMAILVIGAAVALGASRGADTRGAGLRPASAVGPGSAAGAAGVTNLLGSATAVMTVTIHNATHVNLTTASVGTQLHPKVTMGGAFGFPTGEVTGYIFDNSACISPAVNKADGMNLALGAADLTTTWIKPTVAGQISFRVTYAGDAIYAARQSPCISFTITKATPSVSLKVHDGSHAEVTSIEFGEVAHPAVTVVSRVGGPTGTVTVSWWTNGTCSGQTGDSSAIANLVAGKADTTYFQPGFDPGSFSFRAHYEGDAGFKPGDSACVKYTVKKADVAFITSIHDSHHVPAKDVALGDPVHPYASLNGLPGMAAPTGEVGVWYYGDADCGKTIGTGAQAVAPQMELLAFETSRPSPATLSWRITYSGDAMYQAKTGPCLAVSWKAPATLSLAAHDAAHASVSSVEVGEDVHFRVKAAGAFVPAPDGEVSVYAFDNATCSGSGMLIANAVLTDGIGHDTVHHFAWDKPGQHSFVADYAGDDNYFGDESPCRTLTVTAATPAATPVATPKPTTKPATTPAPTADPASTPAPDATSGPAASVVPDASAPAPEATNGAGGGTTTGDAATPSPAPTAAPQPAGAASAGSDTWIIVVLLAGILLLLLVIAFLLGRGRRATDSQAATGATATGGAASTAR